MSWLDDVQYVGALQARFRIAVVLRQQVRARVLGELLNAANSRAMDATPVELLAYAATGRAS